MPLPVTELAGSPFLLASALEILKSSARQDMKQLNKLVFKKLKPCSQAKDWSHTFRWKPFGKTARSMVVFSQSQFIFVYFIVGAVASEI